MTVTVGLENGDVVVQSFQGALDLEQAFQRFYETYSKLLIPLEGLLKQLCGDAAAASGVTVAYGGIDTSINPSLDPEMSLVHAYEAIVGKGRFGKSGSLVSKSVRESAQAVFHPHSCCSFCI